MTREDQEKRRTEVTDPWGTKSEVQFDEANRPVSITSPTAIRHA